MYGLSCKWVKLLVLIAFTLWNVLLQTHVHLLNKIGFHINSSKFQTNCHPNSSENEKYRGYQLRLKAETKRILYWTTRNEKRQTLNRKIKCGSRGKHVCELVSDQSLLNSSHALIFHGWRKDMTSNLSVINGVPVYKPRGLPPARFPDQYWVLYMLESPPNFRKTMRCYEGFFNWTWTYRTDSDVYMPYGQFRKLNKAKLLPNNFPMVLAKKNRTVAFISSNCDVNSKRLNLVKKLQEHLQIDIYGKCGNLSCKSKSTRGCKMEIGVYYKFYLSFENSLCKDYLTEKVFQAYSAGMVPVVYGGSNYDSFLPRSSYINVESFPSAKYLADYLLYLDKNPSEYFKYFKWKTSSILVSDHMDFNNGYCQLCVKLHKDYPLGVTKVIPNVTEWLFTDEKQENPSCRAPTEW